MLLMTTFIVCSTSLLENRCTRKPTGMRKFLQLPRLLFKQVFALIRGEENPKTLYHVTE
jgi:hypothetical protein